MKKICSLLLLISVFVSCKEPVTPPTVVLDELFAAMQQGDFNAMKKHISKNDAALLDAAEKFLATVDSQGVGKIKARITEEMKEQSKNISYKIKSEKIDGNRAFVETEIINTDPKSDSANKPIIQKFELVKEDNAWKIALTKPGNEMFNSMKGNMGSRKEDLKSGVERLKQMDRDSLKMLIGKGVQALDSLDKMKQNQ